MCAGTVLRLVVPRGHYSYHASGRSYIEHQFPTGSLSSLAVLALRVGLGVGGTTVPVGATVDSAREASTSSGPLGPGESPATRTRALALRIMLAVGLSELSERDITGSLRVRVIVTVPKHANLKAELKPSSYY